MRSSPAQSGATGSSSAARKRCGSYPYVGGERVVDPEHVRFLKANARDYYETDDFIFVHASYDPDKPMADQSNTKLQWEARPAR